MNKNSRKSMLLLFTLILVTCFSLLEAGKKVRLEGVILSSTEATNDRGRSQRSPVRRAAGATD